MPGIAMGMVPSPLLADLFNLKVLAEYAADDLPFGQLQAIGFAYYLVVWCLVCLGPATELFTVPQTQCVSLPTASSLGSATRLASCMVR